MFTNEELAKLVIRSLADQNEFLGYQLSAALGAMSAKELADLADKHLREEWWEPSVLAENVTKLAELVPNLVDAEFVATVFRCPWSQAFDAVKTSAGQVAAALDQPSTRVLSAVEADEGEG